MGNVGANPAMVKHVTIAAAPPFAAAQAAHRVRVVIVDDHAVVRQGLTTLLRAYGDFDVVGEGATAAAALRLARQQQPQVLVMDLSMPGPSGVDILRVIASVAPSVGVLVLSGYAEEQFAIPCLQLGARGYLNKLCDPVEIVLAVREIAAGRRYLAPRVRELLVRHEMGSDGVLPPHTLLNRRELQVLLRLARGESTGTVARHLSLSPKTVSTYRTSVLGKLQMRSNGDLVRYAYRHGLLD